jgi:GntR family transcriptional repressor for pyruvate dehydrogenase complex
MEKVNRNNTIQQVVHIFQKEIRDGNLKIGDRLPNEMELAKMLGVGRSSLREALQVLSVYGITESRHGDGTYIVDNRARCFFELLGYGYNKKDMREFLEFRKNIEVGNIATICGKLTEEQFDELDKLILIFEDGHIHKVEEYTDADIQFHAKLISYSNNGMLNYVNDMISGFRKELLGKIFEYDNVLDDARVSHRTIWKCLKNEDRAACIDAVTKHIEVTIHHVEKEY